MKYESIERLNSIQTYIMQMRPVLRKDALFADGTSDYRIPAEPGENETVTLRFRTARDNVDRVLFCHGEERLVMELAEQEGAFDYYEIRVSLGTERYEYHFEIISGKLHCYYDRCGVSRDYRGQYEFVIIPGFSTPDWAKGAVMYQIFTDRFYNGDKKNDVKNGEYYYINRQVCKVSNWDKYPRDFDVADFYGGDLAGVIKKLDYLEELGVEVLYFNPLFVSASSHKYDTQDYDYIDPHFGVILEEEGDPMAEGDTDNTHATLYRSRVTSQANLDASNALFAELVKEAHGRGMKVILDGVFNHCGSFNKWLDREKIYEGKDGFAPGAYISKDSPYHDYFSFQDKNQFPDNGTYEGWWGHDTLPKLNYEGSKELEDYIMHIGRKWVSEPYCADGWRLDVAADLGHSPEYNHAFWRRFRKEVKSANPQALILAEHYGDPKEWLQGDQWDTIMNYDAFMEPVSWFLTGMEKHSEEHWDYMQGNYQSFHDAMTHYMSNFHTSSLLCSMNQLSNHDHSRFLTRTNHKVGRAFQLGAESASQDVKKGIFREAVVIQMTWPGAPTLYYGDEAGVCGYTDPDNRRTYPWGNEDTELLRFHQDIIAIHKNSSALRTGSLKFLQSEDYLLCYGRFDRKEQDVIIVNNDEYSHIVELEVWPLGIPKDGVLKQVMYTTEDTYSTTSVKYKLDNGKLELHIPKYSSVILQHKTKSKASEEAN